MNMAPRNSVTKEERERMIAEAAYFRYLQREPDCGSPIEDWLAAELEIDAKYNLVHHSSKEIRHFYEHMAEESCCHGADDTLSRLRSALIADKEPRSAESSSVLALHHREIDALRDELEDPFSHD